jgi:short-subunit dehydrogenase
MHALDHTRQTTLITGASAGIGAQFARQLAARGSNLVLVARRADRLKELAEQLHREYGREVTPIAFDLEQPAPGAALLREVEARGITVTSVINNAGFGTWGLFHESDPERLRRMIAVDVTAVLDISRAFIDLLRANGTGYLMNISSVAAYMSIPNQGAYSAAKAFVLSFTESLWAETRDTGLRVLAFAPGVTSTEFFDVVGTTDADGGSRHQSPAEVVAEALHVLDRRDPPPSAVSGRRNHFLTITPRLFTRRRAVSLTGANTLRQR